MSTEQKDTIYTSSEYFSELDNSKEGPFGGQECLKKVGGEEKLFKPQDGHRYDKMTKFPIFLYEDDEGKHYCFSDSILQNLNKNKTNLMYRTDKVPIHFVKELDEKECEIEKEYHNHFLENISYSPFKNLITNIYKSKNTSINNDSYRVYSISHNFVDKENFDLLDITDMLSIFFLNSVQEEITLQKMLEQRINYKYGCLTEANSKDSKRKIDEEHEYAILIRESLMNLYEKVRGLIKGQNYIGRLLHSINDLIYNENLNKKFQVIEYLEDKNIQKIEDFLKLKDKKIKNLQDFVKLNFQDFQNLKIRNVKNFKELNLEDLKNLKNFISKIEEKDFVYSDINLIKIIENLEKEERLRIEREKEKEQKRKEEEEKKEKERIQKLKEEEERIVEQKLKEEEERKKRKEELKKKEEEKKVKQEEEKTILDTFYRNYESVESFMEKLDTYMKDYLIEVDSKESEINNLSFIYKVLVRLKYRLKKILNDHKYKNIKLEKIDLEKIEEEQQHIKDTFDKILSNQTIKNIEKIDEKTYEKIKEYKEKTLENINKYKSEGFIFDTNLFPDLGKDLIISAENIVKYSIPSINKKSPQLKDKKTLEYQVKLQELDHHFDKYFKKIFLKYLYLETQKYISTLIKESNSFSTKDLNSLYREEYQLILLEISILLDQVLSPFLLSKSLFNLKISDKILENQFKEYLKNLQEFRQNMTHKDGNEKIVFLDSIQDKLADNIYKEITGKDYNFSEINKTLKIIYNLFKTLKKDENVYHPISHEVKMKLKEQLKQEIKETEPEKIEKSLFISYLSFIFMEYFYKSNEQEFTDYLSPYSGKILKDYQSYLS
jgi:hypothetical protein